jgi:hypothetical protein
MPYRFAREKIDSAITVEISYAHKVPAEAHRPDEHVLR